MSRRALRVVAVLLLAFATPVGVGCTIDRSTEGVARSSAPIIGGAVDTTNTWAVGIDIGGHTCSGTLIAPNLVLTARHCVSDVTKVLDCGPGAALESNKVLGDHPVDAFRVYTGSQVRSGPFWSVNAVRYIDSPLAKRVCGYDLALLELGKGMSGFPTQWMAPSAVAPKTRAYRAIGYGCQTAESKGCLPIGIRQILYPAQVTDIGGPADVGVTDNDFAVNGRVCGGDSGGPLWDSTANVVFGALSRVGAPNPMGATTEEKEGCVAGIYTRTDVHWDWLQKWGKAAATAGGYAPLPWMTAAKSGPDAGPPQPKGGSPAPAGDAGTAVDPEDEHAPGEPQGCTVSRPPPRPQPWIVVSLAAIAFAFLRRRYARLH